MSPDDIGFHLLDEHAPLAPVPSTKVRTEIAVGTAVLQIYVGVYQLFPAFALTITREGNSLYLQGTGQPKAQLHAETPTEFFLKEVDAQVTFEKDASQWLAKTLVFPPLSNEST